MKHLFALLLALPVSLPTFPIPSAWAESDSSESKKTRQLLNPCEDALKNTSKEELRLKLIERLAAYAERTGRKLELLIDQLEELAAEEMKALGGTFLVAPKISPRTMRILLAVYGSELHLSHRERLHAAVAVGPALKRDPYFRWLNQRTGIDSIAFFLKPLESTGSAHLGLSLSLLRLQASLDPSYPRHSARAFPIILFFHAREDLALQDLAKLKMNKAEESWELISELWKISELELFNEHYNAALEGEKHRYPYLDFERP